MNSAAYSGGEVRNVNGLQEHPEIPIYAAMNVARRGDQRPAAVLHAGISSKSGKAVTWCSAERVSSIHCVAPRRSFASLGLNRGQ